MVMKTNGFISHLEEIHFQYAEGDIIKTPIVGFTDMHQGISQIHSGTFIILKAKYAALFLC